MHRVCEFVLAVAENDVIGRQNRLPWRLSADLKHFKTLTLGKQVLMGRKTYQSIGQALPGRTNVVLSRAPDFAPADCTVVRSIAAAQALVRDDEPLMVIGGAQIYGQCLDAARRIYLTLVHAQVDGDAFYSGWRGAEWRESSRERHAADERNEYDYSFVTLERV